VEDGGVGNAPPDGGPDAGGGAPDAGSPSGADGGSGDGGAVPSGGPPDARDLAISGGCTTASAGDGRALLALVLLNLLRETLAARARGRSRTAPR